MKVVVVLEFDNITDPDGPDADMAVQIINRACSRWDTEVGATRVYIDDAFIEEEPVDE